MTKWIKGMAKFSALALVFASLQGCLATAVVGGAAVATKVATDPRTTGRQVDDEVLEEKVAYNLNKDDELKEDARLNVVAYNGKVLLIGQAPNEAAKEQAKNIAAGVEGVEMVYDEIRIGEKIGVMQVTQDGWITTKIKSQLFANSEVKATDVKVITENGEAFLIGKLSNTQADAAANVARNVNGVKRVVKVITYTE